MSYYDTYMQERHNGMMYGDPVPDDPYAGRPAPGDSYSQNYDIAKSRGWIADYGEPIPPFYLWGSPKELQKLAPPPTQTPAQQYPDQQPIDFSGAPAWWGKGGGYQPPARPTAPVYTPPQGQPTGAPSQTNPMVSLLSSRGGQTQQGGQMALASALRNMGG